MSFNRLPYDTCSYKQTLTESVGPGDYQLNRPVVCDPCYAVDPHIRLQSQGASVCQSSPLIDIDSEMLGITRNLSNCSANKYAPNSLASDSCGAQTGSDATQNNSKVNIDYNPYHFKNCFTPTEETRTSNPPCNLRGTGWNRWEWLCKNPQDRVEIPFDYQISSRTVVKDNHRPCIPNPVDQYNAWPQPKDQPICENIVRTCGVPTDPPSVQWRSAEEIKNY